MRRITALSLAMTALALTACASSNHVEDAAYCESVKPGTVTSVNHYCALMHDHPVNPGLTTTWNNQTVGFCCDHCISEWAELSDARKTQLLNEAVAKGKPPG